MEKPIVEVFTTPTCPACPSAKILVAKMENERGDFEYVETNLSDPDAKKRFEDFQIKSVPTILVHSLKSKEIVGFIGTPDEDDLAKAIIKAAL